MIEIKQFYNYVVETAPSALPLSLAETRTHLRITDSCEDTYIKLLIQTVRDFFEIFTNRTLINTTYKGFLDQFPGTFVYPYGYCCEDGILIRKSKVSSITSIKYLLDSVLTTWDNSNYYVSESNMYPNIFLEDGKSYPTTDDRIQAIEIIFVAGYGATNTDIPSDIKMALLNHIAFLYENRGDCGGDGTCELPCATKTIYNKYRIRSIAWGDC